MVEKRLQRSQPLKRVLGSPTALLIGMGVAIGSGIFRTPGEVAAQLQFPWLIIAAWVLGGAVALMQGMVSAELSTRFPEAGGEYVFLREAYGDFTAFFFGWAYTIFVIGGGAAIIARALGDFAAELFLLDPGWSGPLAALAILVVTLINAAGLRAGAITQNTLTCLKIIALLVIVLIGFLYGTVPLEQNPRARAVATSPTLGLFLSAFIPVLWAYSGTTDTVKMGEEVKDVRRAMPRAVIGSAVALILLYVMVNLALMRIVPTSEMAGLASVPGEAMGRLFGPAGRSAMHVVAILVCLGALSSTVLATIRVTFALARDGLTFRFMSYMSKRQAPVPALVVVAAVAMVLVLNRNFYAVLRIYFFASAVLFGLSYASLIIFRLREDEFPSNVYRCPLGWLQAVILIVIQFALAITIAYTEPRDTLYTGALLVAIGALYLVWKPGHRTTGA